MLAWVWRIPCLKHAVEVAMFEFARVWWTRVVSSCSTRTRLDSKSLSSSVAASCPEGSTFLILTVHLTGRIADGLAALLNAIYPQG